MDREGGQGGSALAIQISQAGWTDVIYLSYLSIWDWCATRIRMFPLISLARCTHAQLAVQHWGLSLGCTICEYPTCRP